MCLILYKRFNKQFEIIENNSYLWYKLQQNSVKLSKYKVDPNWKPYIDGTGQDLHLSGLDCLNTPVKCDINKTRFDSECTYCLRPNAKCIHYDEVVHIYEQILPPNSNQNEGYCTPVYSRAYNNDTPITLPQCNINTGIRILIKANSESQGYIFGCKCKEPNLISQETPLLSDCNQVVGCKNGKLKPDWLDTSIIINNLKTLQCTDCGNFTIADRDYLGYPVCRPINYLESPVDPDNLQNTSIELLPLTHEAIDPKFVKSFNYPKSRHVPNPCGFDVFTGSPFLHGECKLCKTRSSDIWYCSSYNSNVATIQFEDDYLKNNHGQWSNGCYRFARDSNMDFPKHKNTIVEWFNKSVDASIKKPQLSTPTMPIVGTLLTQSIALTSEAINFLFAAEKLPLKDPIIYSAPIPDDAPELPFPINNSDWYNYELNDKQFGGDGFPALSWGGVGLTFTPLPATADFFQINIRECKDLPYFDWHWPTMIYNPFYSHIISIGALTEKMTTAFASCSKHPLLKDDKRFTVVPNVGMKNFTNTFIYNYDSGTITPIWYGSQEELKIAQHRLPHIFLNAPS